MHQQADIVLLNPPFYRFMGSHNDKIPLSLTYLSAYLQDEGISHILYNADHTGSSLYWSLKWMCEHYDCFVDAVDGKGSLYGEVLEHVLSFKPKLVLIMGGDPLVATAEWGNPFIAANFSRLLRQQGLYTVGLGPFFTLDPGPFTADFDCIMQGEPSRAITRVFHDRPSGLMPFGETDLDTVPSINHLFPSNQKTNWAMTSFGCPFGCSFCMNAALYGKRKTPVRFVDIDTVVADISQRDASNVYLADLNFPLASIERLRSLLTALRRAAISKSFTIDARVDSISEEKVALLKSLNVRAVKLGVESLKQTDLDTWDKRITMEKTERAIGLLKSHDIGTVFYLLIGKDTSEADFDATASFIRKWKPDFIVPNIHAYDFTSDYRYDTEFSPLRLQELGISKELFYRFLDLQSRTNPTVGEIIG